VEEIEIFLSGSAWPEEKDGEKVKGELQPDARGGSMRVKIRAVRAGGERREEGADLPIAWEGSGTARSLEERLRGEIGRGNGLL